MKILFFTLALCINLIAEQTKNITVMGIGRLGICTALVFERAGYNILGLDISQSYVDAINSKTLVSPEPLVNEYLRKSLNLRATTNINEAIHFSDIYFIVVATPNGNNEAYDHAFLIKLLEDINEHKVKNKHLVICCTVFPGFIDNQAKQILKNCENITISYNPEFIAQGNIIRDFERPDVVLIGEGSKEAGDTIEKIYLDACLNNPKITRMSPASSEIAKLALNCFITTKIAYANMIGDIAQLTPNANEQDILKLVGSDSRVGYKYLNYGYGYGGPCFPRDNRALGEYANSIGIAPTIPSSTDLSNKQHALFMAETMLRKKEKSYVFTDVNYKPNCHVIILEESQKLAVAKILAEKGCAVVIKDREEVINLVKKEYGDLFKYEII